MSTRGAFGLTHRGQTKMIYNHFDSYPEGLGKAFVDWIKRTPDDQLKKAWKNIKLGRCDNYGREKFEDTWKTPQTRDKVTQDQIDEGYYIEYSYNYDIDSHTLITTGEDHVGLQDLEDEIQEDRKTRLGLTHRTSFTTDHWEYKGRHIAIIWRTTYYEDGRPNKTQTTIQDGDVEKTEDAYLTPIEAIELLTNG